jgi:deazaflavin-dependent oxidoreductase (nitroreductase family)
MERMEKPMRYQPFLLHRIRFLNKRIFNRVTLKFAGAPYSPISIIRHQGRRSETPYATPVIAQAVDHGFVFALPYGDKVDWYRNVLEAGQGTVVWRGKKYPVERPEPLDFKANASALPIAIRMLVRLVGARHFIQMKSAKE